MPGEATHLEIEREVAQPCFIGNWRKRVRIRVVEEVRKKKQRHGIRPELRRCGGKRDRDGYNQEFRPQVKNRLSSALVAATVSIACAGALFSTAQSHLVGDFRRWWLGLRLPSGGP
jgi:hypothetical protein